MIVGLFAFNAPDYGFIGIVYGALAALALLISAGGLRERQERNRIQR